MAASSSSASGGPIRPPERPAILDRLAAFLPEMQAANEDLTRRHAEDPAAVSIEHIDDPDAQHIEMNLACGVFEKKRVGDGSDDGGAVGGEGGEDGAGGGMSELRLPSRQTAAVSAAARAGRTLVSVVGGDSDGGDDEDEDDAVDGADSKARVDEALGNDARGHLPPARAATSSSRKKAKR